MSDLLLSFIRFPMKNFLNCVRFQITKNKTAKHWDQTWSMSAVGLLNQIALDWPARDEFLLFIFFDQNLKSECHTKSIVILYFCLMSVVLVAVVVAYVCLWCQSKNKIISIQFKFWRIHCYCYCWWDCYLFKIFNVVSCWAVGLWLHWLHCHCQQ